MNRLNQMFEDLSRSLMKVKQRNLSGNQEK